MQIDGRNRRSFFLLGGYDLEMLTIRGLLEQKGVGYADRHLQWNNANLSVYREELETHPPEEWVVYGVELREDRQPPSHYVAIDHHNSRADCPSALEQVMELLHVSPDRYLQLVAANDKAYIPGMMALGASAGEIERIRRADREAQGVTAEEERLAERALAERHRKVGDLQIVKAISPRFSPICDRLFPYRSLLIYTDKEWTFYGEGAEEVRAAFEEEIRSGNLYFGGGDCGYVGTVQHVFTAGEIETMVRQIEQLNNK